MTMMMVLIIMLLLLPLMLMVPVLSSSFVYGCANQLDKQH